MSNINKQANVFTTQGHICRDCSKRFAVFGSGGGRKIPNRCECCYKIFCHKRICCYDTEANCKANNPSGFVCWFSHKRVKL